VRSSEYYKITIYSYQAGYGKTNLLIENFRSNMSYTIYDSIDNNENVLEKIKWKYEQSGKLFHHDSIGWVQENFIKDTIFEINEKKFSIEKYVNAIGGDQLFFSKKHGVIALASKSDFIQFTLASDSILNIESKLLGYHCRLWSGGKSVVEFPDYDHSLNKMILNKPLEREGYPVPPIPPPPVKK
jgi:hypothetical protein